MKKFNFVFSIVLVVSLVMASVAITSCTPQASQPTGPTTPAATPAQTGTIADKPIQIVFAYFPPPVVAICRAWESWGQGLEIASGGRIKFNFKGGSSMGSPADHYKLVKSGTADMAAICPEFTPGVFPMSAAANLPMLFPSSEVAAGALYQFHKKYTADSDFKDVKFLASSPTAPAQMQSRTKPIKTLEDLQGMKVITMSDQQAKIISILGASPVVMTEGEAYTAMERGLADARFKEWDGTVVWKINEVTKYRTANIDLGMDQMIIIMNNDFWNKLPADIQTLFTGATGLFFSQYNGVMFDRANNGNYSILMEYDRKVGNPSVYMLPDSERQRWEKAVSPILDQWVKDMEALKRPGAAALKDLQNWVKEYKAKYQ